MNQGNFNVKVNQQANNVLFVADLPEETSEEDIIGIFKDHHLKVSKVTSRLGKSFALAHFENNEWAEKARNDLNGMKFIPKYSTSKVGKPIRLCRWETKQSISERRDDDYKKNLLVKNLSKDMSAVQLWNTFRVYGDVRSCKLSVDFQGLSKGFGYITYYNAVDSENARNILNNKELNGKPLIIDFLLPGIRRAIRKNNIYVKHFPTENFTDQDLINVFSTYGEVTSVMIVKDQNDPQKNKGFGFVCFKSSEEAEKAQKTLNGQKLWENLVPLYVSFAMKKEERLEHLQKQKEELIRNSHKMTLFCKIKDGIPINSNEEYIQLIMNYLSLCFGNNYVPKSLKPRVESRNAFITMNSPNEVNLFVGFITNLSKTAPVNLYFNQYKSKIERLQAANQMKNYNNFDGTQKMQYMQMDGQKPNQYNNYNDFTGNSIPNPYMLQQQHQQMMSHGALKNYNNFDEFNPQVQMQNMQMQMGNNQFMNNPQIIHQHQQQSQMDSEEEKGQILDFIYNIVCKVYEADAPKITGMIAELSLADLKILTNESGKLDEVIKSAYNQLHS